MVFNFTAGGTSSECVDNCIEHGSTKSGGESGREAAVAETKL